jgi:hypothetical protein
MADAKKLLRALLAKAYKTPDTEIDRILSDDTDDTTGETEILKLDSGRVGELQKPKKGSTFQDGYAKGKKETLENLEKEIFDTFEIDPDQIEEDSRTGLKLIEHVVATKAKPGKGGNLTEDQIKASPVYQKAEQAWKKSVKDKETEWKTKYDQLESGHKKATVFQTVSNEVLKILSGMNPVLPSEDKVAQTWKKNFVNSFTEFDYEVQDGRIVAMKDGKVVDDGHGSTKDFEALVKERAPEYFEFRANNGGANGGNGKAGEGAGGSGTGGKQYPAGVQKPKTFEELTKIVNDTTIKAEDRQTVLETWETEHATA